MRHIFRALIAGLLLAPTAFSGGTFTVGQTNQILISSAGVLDTLGRVMVTPDSMRVVVTDSTLTELHDAWYESADAVCALNGDVISFIDVWGDINGANNAVGTFHIAVTYASDGSGNVDVHTPDEYVVYSVATSADPVTLFGNMVDAVDSIMAIMDSVQAIMAEVDGVNGLTPVQVSDNIGVNFSDISGTLDAAEIGTDALTAAKIAAGAITVSEAPNLDAAITSRLAPTVAARTLDIATTGEAGVDYNNVLGTLDAAEIGTDALTAAKIAAGAITVSEAPNLDAAITSRLAPTVAARTLDIATTGEAGVDYNNVLGTLDAAEIGADALTAAKVASDVGDEYRTTFAATHGAGSWETGGGGASLASRIIVARGVVAASPTPTATAFGVAALTQADDYWKNNQVFMQDGTAAGQVARISAFATTNDLITVDPAYSAAPTAGDSVYITAILSEAGGGSSPFSSAQRDSLLDNAKDGALTAAKLAADAATEIYDKFVAGSNEDPFKADVSALALEASLLTTSDNIGINADDVNGTFNTADFESQIFTADLIAANSIGASELGADAASEIAVAAYAEFISGSNEDPFKADVSLLALQTEVANLDGISFTDGSAQLVFRSMKVDSGTIFNGATNGRAVWIKGGAGTTGYGLAIDSGLVITDATRAVDLIATATNGVALRARGDGAGGSGFYISGDTYALLIAASAAGGVGIKLDSGLTITGINNNGDAVTLTGQGTGVGLIIDGIDVATEIAGLNGVTPTVAADLTQAQDSINVLMQNVFMTMIQFGAIPVGYDSIKVITNPADGSASKDSYTIVGFIGGTPSTLSLYTYFHHLNVATVADTTTLRRTTR